MLPTLILILILILILSLSPFLSHSVFLLHALFIIHSFSLSYSSPYSRLSSYAPSLSLSVSLSLSLILRQQVPKTADLKRLWPPLASLSNSLRPFFTSHVICWIQKLPKAKQSNTEIQKTVVNHFGFDGNRTQDVHSLWLWSSSFAIPKMRLSCRWLCSARLQMGKSLTP